MVNKENWIALKQRQPLLAKQIIDLAKIEYLFLSGDTSQTLSERGHRYLFRILKQNNICTFTNGVELFSDIREIANS